MGRPTLSIFTGTESLGRVFKENLQLNIKWSELHFPFTDDSGRVAINAFGKLRLILVQGTHTGEGFSGATTEDKLYDFISTMEDWVNASVVTSRVYTPSLYPTGMSVHPVDWVWERTRERPNQVMYSLLMRRA